MLEIFVIQIHFSLRLLLLVVARQQQPLLPRKQVQLPPQLQPLQQLLRQPVPRQQVQQPPLKRKQLQLVKEVVKSKILFSIIYRDREL